MMGIISIVRFLAQRTVEVNGKKKYVKTGKGFRYYLKGKDLHSTDTLNESGENNERIFDHFDKHLECTLLVRKS